VAVAAEGDGQRVFDDCNFVDNVADTGGGRTADADATIIDCNVAASRRATPGPTARASFASPAATS
jgi:hypothetical protein